MVVCALMYYTVQNLFAHLSTILRACMEDLLEQQAAFLVLVKDEGDALNEEEFTARLRLILQQKDEINDAFDQLQDIFRWKLLLDVIANTLILLFQMAWISVFVINPGVQVYSMWSVISLVRHSFYIAVFLMSGGLILIPPISLHESVWVWVSMMYSMFNQQLNMLHMFLWDPEKRCMYSTTSSSILTVIILKTLDAALWHWTLFHRHPYFLSWIIYSADTRKNLSLSRSLYWIIPK